jgi:predicted transcriptional regulator
MRSSKPRYARHDEFIFYCQGRPVWAIAELLRRSPRTIERYIDGKSKIPWWTAEMLRLLNDEFHERVRQQGMDKIFRKLGVVQGDVIEFKSKALTQKTSKTPPADLNTEQCQLILLFENLDTAKR